MNVSVYKTAFRFLCHNLRTSFKVSFGLCVKQICFEQILIFKSRPHSEDLSMNFHCLTDGFPFLEIQSVDLHSNTLIRRPPSQRFEHTLYFPFIGT